MNDFTALIYKEDDVKDESNIKVGAWLAILIVPEELLPPKKASTGDRLSAYENVT